MPGIPIEYWKRLWESNPALKDFSESFPPGWVGEKSGHIVGYIGNIPFRYSLNGNTVKVVAGHKFVAEKGTYPLAKRLINEVVTQPAIDLIISTTAEKSTHVLCRRFHKFVPLPEMFGPAVYFWVIRGSALVRAILLKKGFPLPLATLGGFLAGLPVSVLGRVKKVRAVPQMEDEQCNSITAEQIGESFNELWERVSRKSPKLLAYRDADTLKWYCGLLNDNGEVTIVTLKSGGVLRGYAVLQRADSRKLRLRRQIIIDVFFENGDEQVARRLFMHCGRIARDAGADVLEAPHLSPELAAIARSSGTIQRHALTSEYASYLYHGERHAEALSSPATWSLGPYDGDAMLGLGPT